ncbi:MAG: hypothetical protein KatS3mg031_1555 [Chitinophagales bacterium]|nr:MAG: hypothetical protein KatS3mg031_1555 [Chitinophagales bacterium]
MNKTFLAPVFILLISLAGSAQENVGIGTLTPNPKAILELASREKGFLIPRMTTGERNAINPGGAEIGMMVYNTDDSLFYYWNGNTWQFFPNLKNDGDWTISGNNMYSAVSGNVGIGVANPTAKLHTQGSLRFAGLPSSTQTLVLVVDLNGNVSTRTLGNDVWDGDAVNDADADPSNECNTSLFYNITNQQLVLVDPCTTLTATIPTDPNDFDKDSTNELQTLSSFSTGSNVTIQISRGNQTTFSINDGDASSTNELQTLAITKSGTDVNWSLSNGGGSGTFNVDDQDWSGAGTGSMYATSLTDKVGIGNSAPSFKLDVSGDIRTTGKLLLSGNNYYVQNSGTDLLLFSANHMKLQTNKDHEITLEENGSEAVFNVELEGSNVLTVRGNKSVGIGTYNPVNTLQVAGDVRIGLINTVNPGGSNYGNVLYFSGGPVFSGLDSDNDDLIFLARYNSGSNQSELRLGVGDDHNSSSSNLDRFSIGTYTSGGGLNSFSGLFDFEMESPSSSNGPMLSISPNGTTANKSYNGALAITKPATSNGQYINLARGSSSTVWSIGFQYNTSSFAISPGTTNDAAFATVPYFTITSALGYVGLGVATPSNRLTLPNENSTNGQGLANAWQVYSDGRFKKEREDIGTVLNKVMQLKPIYYRWEKYHHDSRGKLEGTGQISDNRDMGFIAQDVYKLFPEIVSRPEDETRDSWAMDYARLTVVLTKAIQEQQRLLEEEKNAHNKTQAELAELKKEVEKIKRELKKLPEGKTTGDLGMKD